MDIGDRLREERERIGLSQSAFGEAGGVKKLAQINYEKNERKPDAGYLRMVSALGVDVLYVVTGRRAAAEQDRLPPRERVLLENYRGAGAEGKRAIERAAMLEAQGGAVGANAQTVRGNNNVVAGRSISGVPKGRTKA